MDMISERISKYVPVKTQAFAVGVLAFVVLVLWNFRYLNNPPYWDDILGLHNQAIWLAKNNFNLINLWQPGQSYPAGGSNVYQINITPLFYGLLYYLLPAKDVHIIGHLTNIAALAVIIGFFYNYLKTKNIRSWLALLWCASVLVEPVMAGRSAALGQDILLAAAGMAVFFFIMRNKFYSGLVIGALAYLIKYPGVLLVLAIATWLLVRIIYRLICSAPISKRNIVKLATTIIAAAVMVIVYALVFKTDNYHMPFSWQVLMMKIRFHWFWLLPVSGTVFAIILALGIGNFLVWFRSARKCPRRALKMLESHSFLLFIFIVGFWSAYFLYPIPLPRYACFVIPPMYLYLATNLRFKLSALLAGLLLISGLLCLNGSFYLPLPLRKCRTGEFLERSREYLPVIEENRIVCKKLEKNYFNDSIVATWPFVQMLTVPEFGYVEKNLPNVLAVGVLPKYTPAGIYSAGQNGDSRLVVFSFNTFSFWLRRPEIVFNPDKDEMLIQEGRPPASVFVYRKNSRR